MKPSPKVSIIVPCFNVQNTISNCLGFIQDQLFEDFEVICVNDGSVDNTADFIEPFLIDKRFKYISQKNKGLGGARNTGIRAASGEYLTFVDGDDWLLPTFVGRLYGAAAMDNLDIVDALHEELDNTGGRGRKRNSVDIGSRDYYLDILAGTAPSNACARLFRASLIKNNDLYFQEHLKHEDIPWTYRCYFFAEKHATVPEVLYIWNVIGDSISRSFSLGHAEDLLRCLDLDWRFARDQRGIPSYAYSTRVLHIWKVIAYKLNELGDQDVKTQILNFLYQRLLIEPRCRVDRLTKAQSFSMYSEQTRINCEKLKAIMPAEFNMVLNFEPLVDLNVTGSSASQIYPEMVRSLDNIEATNRAVLTEQRASSNSMYVSFSYLFARVLHKLRVLKEYPKYDVTVTYLFLKLLKR